MPSEDWKRDLKVIIKENDLNFEKKESEIEKIIIVVDLENSSPPYSHEAVAPPDVKIDGFDTSSGTISEESKKKSSSKQNKWRSPSTEIKETNFEQHNPSCTQPHSEKNHLRRNPEPRSKNDNRYWITKTFEMF